MLTATRTNYVLLVVCLAVALIVYLRFGQGIVLQYTLFIFSMGMFVQWAALGFSALHGARTPTFTSVNLLALWSAAGLPFALIDRPEFPLAFALGAAPLTYALMYALITVMLIVLRRMSRMR